MTPMDGNDPQSMQALIQALMGSSNATHNVGPEDPGAMAHAGMDGNPIDVLSTAGSMTHSGQDGMGMPPMMPPQPPMGGLGGMGDGGMAPPSPQMSPEQIQMILQQLSGGGQ